MEMCSEPGIQSRPGRHRCLTLAQICIPVAAALGVFASSRAGESNPPFRLTKRVVTQDQGAWVIDYWVRANANHGIILLPEEISLSVEGWVSNSRVKSHAAPRWSALSTGAGPELHAIADVIPAADEATRCRERLAVAIWSNPRLPTPLPIGAISAGDLDASLTHHTTLSAPLSTGPNGEIRVRIRLDHQHILQGEYDPLLGVREIAIRLGPTTLHDVVPLDREQYLALPKGQWPEPPEERKDTRQARSGPDSLHIEAHIPGRQFYRYPARPVRHGTRMVLRFWYLIAEGTEGECRVRLAQIKDTPISYRVLTAGVIDEQLRKVGRWTKVERVVTMEEEATKVTLEFKILGEAEVGEMWIDDVSLEPLGASAGGP